LIFRNTGPISERLYVTGFAWSPSYLYAGRRPVLFEAGFHCAGRLYERDIKRVLGKRQPEILFLTHVHYDHSGATAYLKKCFPRMKVAASPRAADIMKRPNAVKLMGRLSENMVGLAEKIDGIDADLLLREPFEPFTIDMILEDGQTIALGEELEVRVLATPGHTSDLLSYYIPGERILVATEAAGLLWQNGLIGTEFLVDFDQYMESLVRLADLDVYILCQGHHFVFVGDQVKEFFKSSIEAALRFRSEVEELLDRNNGSIDRVVALMKAREYDTNRGVKQPEGAYLLNLKARVTHLAERAKKRRPEGLT
jgi:2-aminobenzoylacetyl-CoA thioesterase